MIIDEIRKQITPGTVIPKPRAQGEFTIKGWGTRRGKPALVYHIPNHRNPKHPYEKGITVSEFEAAARQLDRTGEIDQSWFKKVLPGCATEGSCNFTSLGGIFELLGRAEYAGPGVYRRRS